MRENRLIWYSMACFKDGVRRSKSSKGNVCCGKEGKRKIKNSGEGVIESDI